MGSIEFKNVTFSYRKNKKLSSNVIFNNLSVIFPLNSFNVIVGQSGCGKTTLLRLLTGFLDDYTGDILINGVNTDKLSVGERNIAYINQNYVLYPHLTVFDNIAFPLKAIGAPKDEIIARVIEVSKQLDLLPTLSRKPKYLSGGQRQRVALARGIVKNANIYLFDEPLSNIEQNKRVEQRMLIKKIIKANKATAIYVTHDFTEALAIADRLYVIDNGEIVASGTPMEVFNSNNEVVKEFKKATFANNIYETVKDE